jgi:hypothetical protein
MVLSEGYDEPGIDCVVKARPTKSSALYIQCVGRGARTSASTGKTDCLVLDFVDASSKHSLATFPVLAGIEPKPASGGAEGATAPHELIDLAELADRPKAGVGQPDGRPVPSAAGLAFAPDTPLATVERAMVLAAVAHFDGDKKRAAATLGVSLKTLYARLREYRTESEVRE